MGSIAFILSRTGPPDGEALRRMLAASPHRGTIFDIRLCGNAILGTSNSTDADDATISTGGELSAVCSGRLDNAGELARDLTALGFSPASDNAADVVIAAFRAYGIEAPSRFRGVFAAVLTDGHRAWAFRDHLGFQPLFSADGPRRFVAATEVKQVIAGADIAREPDTEVLEQIFYGHLKQNSPSAFKGVSRVPHSTTVAVNGHGAATFQRYWNPRCVLETAKFSSFEEIKARFDKVFEQAVARCLTGSDVVSLSGGVDSPAVAGFAAPLARRGNGRLLGALSLVFPEHPRVDERPHIEVVTKFLNIDLHTFVSKSRINDDLLDWMSVLDSPVPNISAPQMHEFYREARRLGYRNILTGDIAECVVDLRMHVAGHLLIHGRWKPLVQLLSTQRKQGASLTKPSYWRTLASQLALPFIPGRLANWYVSRRGGGFPKRVPDWIDPHKANELPFRNDLLPPGRVRWSTVQMIPLEGCPITMEGVEICSSLAGVTVRRPFADVDLWEFFLSLPAEIKYPDLRSKTLLRRLLRGKVPDPILDRRDKTYFDDHVMSQVDYPVLKRFLSKPDYRVKGVDYEKLDEHLDRRDLDLRDWLWLKDLLQIHVFLKQW
jgi:asparagine synthase (glutamine-hydrolysing)